MYRSSIHDVGLLANDDTFALGSVGVSADSSIAFGIILELLLAARMDHRSQS